MSQKKFLTAEWRKLIMANYEIDPAILKIHSRRYRTGHHGIINIMRALSGLCF